MRIGIKILTAALLQPLLLLSASQGGAAAAQTPPPPASPTQSVPPPPAPRAAPTPQPLKVVPDPSARAGWTRYQFGDSPAFSLLMPARPTASALNVASREDPDTVAHLYLAEGAAAAFSAQRVDGFSVDMDRVPEAAKRGLFDIFIKGFMDSFREEMRRNGFDFAVELRAPKKSKAAGREAFEQDFAYGPLDGRAQVVFAGHSAFAAIAVWSREAGLAADRETFFQSFRLAPAPKPD